MRLLHQSIAAAHRPTSIHPSLHPSIAPSVFGWASTSSRLHATHYIATCLRAVLCLILHSASCIKALVGYTASVGRHTAAAAQKQEAKPSDEEKQQQQHLAPYFPLFKFISMGGKTDRPTDRPTATAAAAGEQQRSTHRHPHHPYCASVCVMVNQPPRRRRRGCGMR